MLIFLVNDVGLNLMKKVIDKSNYYKIEVFIVFLILELSDVLGKLRKVVVVVDVGFLKKMRIFMV